MNILLVENVWMGQANYGFFDKTFLTTFSILPTLYTRQLAAITPKKHTVTVCNERYHTIPFHQPFDLVNINYTTSTAPHAYEIAECFRRKEIPVVLSGLHASALPNEAACHADSVLLGRGEINWLTLLHDAERKQLKKQYQPEPYTDTISLPPTNVQLPGFVINGAVEATRGCPYRCTFCPEANIPGGHEYYERPIEEVVEEIRTLPQKFFNFYDNSLTIHPSYTKELFTQLQEVQKPFSCNGNADVLAEDTELVELAKKAGCVSWLIGFESISQETINTVGKTTNKVDTYKQAIDNIHNHDIVVIGDFMFGFDTETKNVFDQTLQTIQRLGIDVCDFCILTPFPGTPLFNKLEREHRMLTKDWSQYTLKNVVFQPKHMTQEELKKGVQTMYKQFYATTPVMKRITKSFHYGIYPWLLVLERSLTTQLFTRQFVTS
jgi:radical SAM superfamily enzyme YgiQ (UPF0313 family)